MKSSEQNFYHIIGNNIRAARKMAGKTQVETASVLGVSFQQLQKYELGKNRIPMYHLLNLANFFEISYSDLMETKEISLRKNRKINLRDSLQDPEIQKLLALWTQIEDPKIRQNTLNVLKRLATVDSE